jgi:hypothetical protein
MDRFALEYNLRGAAARVVACQAALLSQRAQVRELEQCGLDASPARALLNVYEQTQKMALFDRNRLTHALEAGDYERPHPAGSIDEHEHDVDDDLFDDFNGIYHRQAA